MSEPHDSAKEFGDVQANIRDSCKATVRETASVSLIAVSKTHDAERILPVLQVGHRIFGENRVQEAGQKWPQLKEQFPDTELHLIGPLQSNKARQAAELFDVIETVDREKIAKALSRAFVEVGRNLPCFVQVNTGAEPQKAGIAPEDAAAFVRDCQETYGLNIVGLMCIPPAGELAAPHFALLKKLAGEAGLSQLSMGMSGDYETAIRFGATHVRVGTAIFGARDYPVTPGK